MSARKGVAVSRTRLDAKAGERRMLLSEPWQREGVAARIRQLPMDNGQQYVLTIRREEDQRSLDQNRRYWAIIAELADATGNSREAMHEWCKARFLGRDTVTVGDDVIEYTRSTAKLSTRAFFQYTEKVCDWAAQEFGLVFA